MLSLIFELFFMKQTSKAVWETGKGAGMNVPVRVIATEELLKGIEEGALEQGKNVAQLPGIVNYSMMMPDAHFGYGFPIGGVAAFDPENHGVVSPGGIGFDLNCGVKLIKTNLTLNDIKPKFKDLMKALYKNVPSGVGSDGRLNVEKEIEQVALEGAEWAVEAGYGVKKDLEKIEENGTMSEADFKKVSDKARQRGKTQLGTLGSGNHFLEVQLVDAIYDKQTAQAFGVNQEKQVTVMVHTGSRGFGHQIADDYMRVMDNASNKFGIKLSDRQLACAPLDSKEAQDYLVAMRCGVNFAFANRQVMTHWIRETFEQILGKPWQELGMDIVYDLSHNIAKYEEHKVDGEKRLLCVHRKGATRAFPPSRKETPRVYAKTGHPVLIPGSMGTASYVLVGEEKSLELTWGSSAHGAGRTMSRSKALRTKRGEQVKRELEAQGRVIEAGSMSGIAEEMPEAYKDVDEVVKATEQSGISRKIIRLTPLGVVKG